MFDERIHVKIRSCQVIKLILTGFFVAQENIKPLVFNAQTSQARSIFLRPRALYFPVQHKTGCSLRSMEVKPHKEHKTLQTGKILESSICRGIVPS